MSLEENMENKDIGMRFEIISAMYACMYIHTYLYTCISRQAVLFTIPLE